MVELLTGHWWENVRELEGLVTRVAAFSTVMGQPVTRVLVEQALGIAARRPPRRVTVDDVTKLADTLGYKADAIAEALVEKKLVPAEKADKAEKSEKKTEKSAKATDPSAPAPKARR